MKKILLTLIISSLLLIGYSKDLYNRNKVEVGAEQFETYKNLIEGKNVALVVNQTSMVKDLNLVDFLVSKQIRVKMIFAPEHGFRGDADAGAHIEDGVDFKTGISIMSLYGKNRKPSKEVLKGIDAVVLDIQDVGTRFYTYISTMHYVMEACAENNIDFIVLDRPNPNGFYVDGNVLDTAFKSFVGIHPVPIVHGMTIAEYAQMVNEEGWLANGVKCRLHYVKCQNYNHLTLYEPPVKPSPNLPNATAIYLYPSTCYFEGTYISEGRGTDAPFQCFGAPDLKNYKYTFTPHSIKGADMYPKHKDQLCYGMDLRNKKQDILSNPRIDLSYLIGAYKNSPKKDTFFKEGFFNKLFGGKEVKAMIIAGKTEKKIKASWKKDLDKFKKMRKKYLLYKDF